jgi:hypothetical protein
VAAVIKTVEAEVVKVDEVKEVAIKAEVNIKVKDVVIELKEEEVTIALIIGYYY